MSKKYQRPLTLDAIPTEEWKQLARQGFDFLWLIGVWKRSPLSRQIALQDQNLKTAFDQNLPGWQESDVAGSPYAIFGYELDPHLGKNLQTLASLRKKLHQNGLRLMLDFVPNHLAADHPWTKTQPDFFIQPSAQIQREHPEWFYKTSESIYLAHGRDPYFPPWTDTVQVNFFSEPMRRALLGELEKISAVCDGVRCDMAMLALNEVFASVWATCLGPTSRPQSEFWEIIIPKIRSRQKEFIFMAEVYWGLEPQLLELGFDFVYDKRLYDQLLHTNTQEIKRHLHSPLSFHSHAVHFIENHDEQRSMRVFGPEKAYAAAAVIATLPGMRFFQDGQMEGKRICLPVQLRREPSELTPPDFLKRYRTLLDFANDEILHNGQWRLVEMSGSSHLLSWEWIGDNQTAWVIINYSDQETTGEKVTQESGARELSFYDTAAKKNSYTGNPRYTFHLQPWEVLMLKSR